MLLHYVLYYKRATLFEQLINVINLALITVEKELPLEHCVVVGPMHIVMNIIWLPT